jgi:hypothetical protein
MQSGVYLSQMACPRGVSVQGVVLDLWAWLLLHVHAALMQCWKLSEIKPSSAFQKLSQHVTHIHMGEWGVCGGWVGQEGHAVPHHGGTGHSL